MSKGMRIMLVEDKERERQELSRMLVGEKYEVK